jgi:hypothetical protein
MGGGGAMYLICMCPSCIPDPVSLLWKEGAGKNEIDVTPSKVIGLNQVLELFNIRIWVSGERAKALFYLREVSKGEGDMDPHNAFHSGHFPGEGRWKPADWGFCESECMEGSWDPVVLGEWKGGRKEGREEERKEGWEEGQETTAEQWKPVSDKVEAS